MPCVVTTVTRRLEIDLTPLADHQVEISAYGMIRPPLCLSNRSNPSNRPRYSGAFTVKFIAYFDADVTLVHSGSFHTIALYTPLFRLDQADPSKLITKRFSSSSTVCGGIVIVSLGIYFNNYLFRF